MIETSSDKFVNLLFAVNVNLVDSEIKHGYQINDHVLNYHYQLIIV